MTRQPPPSIPPEDPPVELPIDVNDLELAWIEATCEQWLTRLGRGVSLVPVGEVIDVMLDFRQTVRRVRGSGPVS